METISYIDLDKFISVDRMISCTLELSYFNHSCKAKLPIASYSELIHYIKTENIIGQMIRTRKSMKYLKGFIKEDFYMTCPGEENTAFLLQSLCNLSIGIVLTIKHRPYKIHNSMEIPIEGTTFDERYSAIMEYTRLNSRVEHIYLNMDLSVKYVYSVGSRMPIDSDYENILLAWHPYYIETKKLVEKYTNKKALCVTVSSINGLIPNISNAYRIGIAVDLCPKINDRVFVDDNYSFIFPLTEFSRDSNKYIYKPCAYYDCFLTSSVLDKMNFMNVIKPPKNSIMYFILGLYNGEYRAEREYIDDIISDANQNKTNENYGVTVEDLINIKNKYASIRKWLEEINNEGE